MKYEIELTDEQLKEIIVQQTKPKESKPEYDFSEFVGRMREVLAIKGQKLLITKFNGDIRYDDNFRNKYNEPLSYTECKLSELEYGDVFIEKNNVPARHNFSIYMGYCRNTGYVFQYIANTGDVQLIKGDSSKTNKEVIKINRD